MIKDHFFPTRRLLYGVSYLNSDYKPVENPHRRFDLSLFLLHLLFRDLNIKEPVLTIEACTLGQEDQFKASVNLVTYPILTT